MLAAAVPIVATGTSLSFVGGCGPEIAAYQGSARFMRTGTTVRPSQASGRRVQVYTAGRPGRAFVEMGIIIARDFTYAWVLQRARHEAARRGCDGLVALGSYVTNLETTWTYAGRTYDREHVGRFTRIVWRDSLPPPRPRRPPGGGELIL